MTRVLVVDDLEPNRYLLRAILTGAGFEVLDSYTIADLADKRRSLRERLGLKLEELTEFTQH